jgi:Ser/Thr protein kinase RdoA (MazF antagonist)
MKPYEELTHLGRLRILRQLACAALGAYGLGGARFKLLRQAGNTLFRVLTSDSIKSADDRYEEGHYLLRIHQPGYQAADAIELELAWLAAMCRDAHLPVQEPVPTLDGRLLIPVSIPGIAEARNCSLRCHNPASSLSRSSPSECGRSWTS